MKAWLKRRVLRGRRLSISTRIALLFGISLVVLTVLVTCVVIVGEALITHQRVDARLNEVKAQVLPHVMVENGQVGWKEGPPLLARMDTSATYLRLLSSEGVVLYRSPNFEGEPPLPVARPSSVREATASRPWRGTYVRSRYVPLTGAAGHLQGWVELSMLESDPHDFMSYVWLLLASFGLSTLLATAGGYVFAKRVLRPVSRLTEAAGEIGATDLNVQLPVDAQVRDELTDLAETFNAMLGRLEASFARERRFTAHAAHELRTPLARMQSEIELARRTPEGRKSAAALARLHEDVTQMSAIVDRLLVLSRLEALEDLPREPVNLSALCEKHLARLRDRTEEQKICLRQKIEPDLYVTAGRVHLEEVLDNLLENALKYTPSGGAITVTLQREEQMARLVVADTGVGFSADEAGQLFDRFFRSDAPGVQAQTGSGLGLAVVRVIAEAYGGSAAARSEGLGRGSTFEVTFPVVEKQ